MGQSVSRRIVPTLERWRAKYQERLTNEALEIIDKQKQEAMRNARRNNPNMISTTLYTDPNARISGFTRGQQYQRISEEELESLSNAGSNLDEMDPKLLQFLKDVGPATKVLNEEKTSRRVVEAAKYGNQDHDHLTIEGISRSSINGVSSATPLRYPTASLTQTNSVEVELKETLTDDQITKFLLDVSSQSTLSPTMKKALQTVSIPIFTLQEKSTDKDEAVYVATAAPLNKPVDETVSASTTAPNDEIKVKPELS
jgi:hypothetical protein